MCSSDLAAQEEELFEIFKNAADIATLTCTGDGIVQRCLPEVGIALSLDVEASKEYFRQGNPYAPKTIHFKYLSVTS